jgi:hypothetical protein
MRRAILIVLFGGLVYGSYLTPSSARAPYFETFKEKYGADDKTYEDMIVENKCFICHVGKSRKNRNSYGMALSKHLKNEKDKDKIKEAMKKVESDKADKAPDAKTFGELIKEHKLPGGPPKKED